jgi:hypothetical protein
MIFTPAVFLNENPDLPYRKMMFLARRARENSMTKKK